MLYDLFPAEVQGFLPILGAFVSFLLTFILTHALKEILPKDQGRAFAVNGAKSEGKPRGAGIIFVTVFAVCALLFVPISIEHIIYIVLVYASMMTGFLDDRADKPWNEYLKGILDLIIAMGAVATYMIFNHVDGGIHLQLFYRDSIGFTMPYVPFAILGVILIWVSINVVNCSDGVDGLSGCLSIVSMLSVWGIMTVKTNLLGTAYTASGMLLIFALSIVAYLWFNASPSKLLMGDAGSRAIGFFLALMCLKSGSPFLFIPIAIVFILDGGLGLVKVFLLRFLKIKILANTRTPIHDHMRKNLGWSDTQTVFRFTIIQAIISLVFLGLAWFL